LIVVTMRCTTETDGRRRNEKYDRTVLRRRNRLPSG
jgi:hypothetical protein